MTMFTGSKLYFIKFFSVFIALSTSTISIAQTNEKVEIESKTTELGITTTDLQRMVSSAIRNGYRSNTQPEALTRIVLTGQAASDNFGISVWTAGDVNGDGYSDVIVGSRYNDAGGFNAGTAYIYFGGVTMDSTADVIMTGEAAGDLFGLSVSTAGDVNGDGYSDVIVGAVNNDAGGVDAGRAYIFFGGISMDNIADVIMTGEAADDSFGWPVSTAGDVNGDGYSDVIVGAVNNGAGGVDAGRAYIFLGGISMDNIADVTMTGEATGDYFGHSVSTAGDVNGDGYSDVIVGAYGNDVGGNYAGRSYIYLGSASMDNVADVIMTGEAGGDQIGLSVSTAGDVNGDGYSDVILGLPYNVAGNKGSSYIYLGGISMDNTVDVVMTGESEGDAFGRSVSTAGDVNGDGYGDVIVGASSNDAAGIGAGRAYIFFGGISMDNTADVTMTGDATYDAFGQSVSTAGDVDGDGYSNFIVGASGNDAGGSNAGSAYLYFFDPENFWEPTGFQGKEEIMTICINPFNNNIYAGTSYEAYLSQDNGDTWTQTGLSTFELNSIDINANGTLFAASTMGLHRSTDAGTTWEFLVGIPTYCCFKATVFNSLDHIFTNAGDTTGILRSEDNGNTWTLRNQGLSGNKFYDLAINSNDKIYAGKSSGIFRSNNNGDTWTQILPNVEIFSLDINKNNHIFGGRDGGIVRSTNDGSSWALSIYFSTSYIWTLLVLDDGHIYAGSWGEGVFHSTDNGDNWEQLNEGLTNLTIWSLAISQSGYLFAGTSDGIFRSLDPVTSIAKEENSIPSSFILSQNYPNPFNPTTKIKYRIPEISFATIKVFDVLGREVKTLLNEEKPAGSYTVEFDGTGLPSGIYFYRLQAGSFVETKKMVLMK